MTENIQKEETETVVGRVTFSFDVISNVRPLTVEEAVIYGAEPGEAFFGNVWLDNCKVVTYVSPTAPDENILEFRISCGSLELEEGTEESMVKALYTHLDTDIDMTNSHKKDSE